MSLKRNRVLSPARSSRFAAVLYLFCTDCSSVVGERRTAVHGHQLSAQALEAAVWDCNATLQSCWAFEKPQLGLVERAKCSRVGLSPFCHSCRICEQIVFFANVSARDRGLERKWILCVLVRWEKKGLVLAAFLCTPECCTGEVCMLHCLTIQCNPPPAFHIIWFVKTYWWRGKENSSLGSWCKVRNSCWTRVVTFFIWMTWLSSGKARRNVKVFPFSFSKLMLWSCDDE